MEETIRKNFCKYCKRKCDNGCINVAVQKNGDLTVYRCTNYQNDIQLDPCKKYIKFDYHDDNGNFIAIIKPRTPFAVLVELRKFYDFVKCC